MAVAPCHTAAPEPHNARTGQRRTTSWCLTWISIRITSPVRPALTAALRHHADPHPSPPVRLRLDRSTVAFALVLVPCALRAQDVGYRQPPEPIRSILDAPPTPLVTLSPDRRWMLLLERPGLPSIAELSAPELGLAGLRIDPRSNGPSRGTSFTALQLKRVDDAGGAARTIAIPAGTRVADVAFSPDARRVAFSVERDDAIEAWVADVASGQARRLGDVALNATLGNPCTWLGSDRLVCRIVPANRGAAPSEARVPTGPVVQENKGRMAPNRTYEDLLQDPHDEALFDYYMTSQLAVLPADGGSATTLGAPAIYAGATASPDARWLLVETVRKPYSYVVPLNRFPTRTEVWDAATGKSVATVADRTLDEERSTAFDAVAKGPRNVSWRADAPATLAWAEALDNGDPATKVDRRDKVVLLDAPFTGSPRTIAQLERRFAGVTWGGATTVVNERWWRTRQARSWIVDPASAGTGASAPRKLFDYSYEDRYADPGRLATVANAAGRPELLRSKDGRFAYLTGDGASAEGDRPFVDRLELATGKTTRLWRSAAPYYEDVVALLDGEATRMITRRESQLEAPNYWMRDLRTRRAPTQLTKFADPAPQFAGITRKLIRYKRADGVELSATMYLPPGYDSTKGPLPFLFWAYPTEFVSAAAAAQMRGSPYRFSRPSGASHLFVLTQGYGVLDDPSMPIVSIDGKESNDSYVEQLVGSAKAAVDEVVRLGVADRDRIGVGGHSYGAFMTANLLAHSDLFRAGIARSGAYNRTLTPFGFQQEERPYWQAIDIYTRMSPFTYADKINEPILLIHGMADDNSGTFPIQSERFFAALKGNGATVRYVQLPAEAHGYRGRESVGHTMWEMVTWLDTYVKPAKAISAVP